MNDDRYPQINLIFTKQEWTADAACRDMPTDWWFPERGGDYAKAKRICHQCPVKQQCLDYALTLPVCVGIWGGTSGIERRRLKSTIDIERPINHGTHSGYVVHRKRNENPCDPCKNAHNLYKQTRKRILNRDA